MGKTKRGLAVLMSALLACSAFTFSASAEVMGKVSDATLAQWSNSLKTSEQYFMMEYLEDKAGWETGYDIMEQTAWLYNPTSKMLFSYESQRSLQTRADYVMDNDLAGCIVWDAQGDRIGTFPMFKTLKTELADKGKDVIAYFGNWMAWGQSDEDRTQGQTVTQLPWNQVTCINYSFFGISNGKTESLRNSIAIPKYKIVTLDEHLDFGLNSWNDSVNAAKAAKYGGKPEDWSYNLVEKIGDQKAKHAGVDVMLSVGGWTRSNMFSEMASTKANRTVFIDSCVEFLNDYPHFDGIDLDWEYPGVEREPEDQYDAGNPASDADRENLVLLVKEMREAFDSEFPGQDKKITTCVAAAPEKQACFDAVEIAKYVDRINIMSYDYYGNWSSTFEGYNSPMFNDDPEAWCTDNSVQYLLNQGVDSGKINVGSPFYAFGYNNVTADADGNPSCLLNPMVESMTSNNMTITAGQTQEADASYTFTDNSSRKVSSLRNDVTATSANEAVVTTNVDRKTGEVTVKGVAAGTAKVTVASPQDSISTTFTVTVSGDTVTPPTVTGTEFAMKLDSTYAYKNGTVEKTSGSNNDGQGVYYAQLRFEGSSLVLPLRYVAESAGLEVGYDSMTGLTTITDGETTVKIIQDSSNIIVVKGGVESTVDIGTPAKPFRQVLHIPVRGVLNQFDDLTIKYDYFTGFVTVTNYEPDDTQFATLISKAQTALTGL